MAIKITYNKQDYVLEYTRESVKQMENTGFNINQLGDKPANMMPMLFYGAFLAKNKGIKRKLVDEIYDNTPNRNELMDILGEMYADTLLTIIDGEQNEGNAIWEVM